MSRLMETHSAKYCGGVSIDSEGNVHYQAETERGRWLDQVLTEKQFQSLINQEREARLRHKHEREQAEHWRNVRKLQLLGLDRDREKKD